MFKPFFVVIISGVVATVQSGPMPQQRIRRGQNQRQDEYAVDHFTTGLVGNPKIRKNYMDCFLDNGPCSPEAYNIKRMVPEAIQNECEHCTDLQRKVIEKMMCYLNNHQPDILKEVAAKFDPQGEYMKQYINTIERRGNDQFLNPQLHQHQPQQNPNQPQQNPNQPQQNPNQPQQNPNQPQQNPNQPQQNPNQPQQNPNQPQQNPNQPQQNSNQPQRNPNQPQQIPNQSHQNPNQPQQNSNQPQPNPNQPRQHQHHYQPQQNPNQPQQHQHQHQHQPQQYQNQPQQYQHGQQLRATVVTSAPISTATQKP